MLIIFFTKTTFISLWNLLAAGMPDKDHMFRDGGHRLVCTAHGVSVLASSKINGKYTFYTEFWFWILSSGFLPTFFE